MSTRGNNPARKKETDFSDVIHYKFTKNNCIFLVFPSVKTF